MKSLKLLYGQQTINNPLIIAFILNGKGLDKRIINLRKEVIKMTKKCELCPEYWPEIEELGGWLECPECGGTGDRRMKVGMYMNDICHKCGGHGKIEDK